MEGREHQSQQAITEAEKGRSLLYHAKKTGRSPGVLGLTETCFVQKAEKACQQLEEKNCRKTRENIAEKMGLHPDQFDRYLSSFHFFLDEIQNIGQK
jgi:hypothetical protein